MTPEQFVREHRRGRMTVDRAVWIMEQYPEVREWWKDLCATMSKLAKQVDAMVVDAGRDLADEAEEIANQETP